MAQTTAPKKIHEISERDFQRQVTDLAELFGWEWHHPQLSVYSKRGWPDLALVRDRLLLLELKKETGQPSPDQCRWLEALQRVNVVETHLFRPSDLEEIAEILRRRES